MDGKELMIGDWVFLKNGKVLQTCQVTVIGNATLNRNDIGKYVCLDTSDEFPTCIFEIEKISPIPLTAEILEKNGFSHNKIWHNLFIDIGSFYIDIQFGYGGKVDNIRIREEGKGSVIPSEQNNIYLAHIEYVHQLQHAMRICGIGKEIIRL